MAESAEAPGARERGHEWEEEGFLCWRRMGISLGVSRADRRVTADKKDGQQHPWFYQPNSLTGLNLKTRGAARTQPSPVEL